MKLQSQLHASWRDAHGIRKDAIIHDYTTRSFIRDAENYTATDGLLAMLGRYADRGGLSPQAQDMLRGKQIGLLSWFRSILHSIRDHGIFQRSFSRAAAAAGFRQGHGERGVSRRELRHERAHL